MLEQLKQDVCYANLDLVARGVVIYTWGNVSGISDDRKYMVIKPSGVDYDGMSAEDMVVVDIESGETVEGKWKPSSDTKTHLALYKKYSQIKGIVHTHSTNAVAFAQAGMKIPALGTTHADYFYGDIPCTRELSKEEVMEAYELNTGKVIIETIEKMNYDPMAIPGIVVKNHGPFAWGSSPCQCCIQCGCYGKCSGDGYQNAVTQFTGRDEAICVGQALYEKTRPECLLWAEVISIERKRSKTCENITDF